MTTALKIMDTKSADLANLAEQINAEHRRLLIAMNAGLHHALEAGRLLIEAKALCKHGDWLPWLEENFEGSTRTAQNYIRVAQHFPQLDGKAQRVADLSYRQAVKLLGDDSRKIANLPDAEQDLVLNEAEGPAGRIALATHIVEERQRAEHRAAAAKRLPQGNDILTGDMTEVGSTLEADSVDLIFTDPPYLADAIDAYNNLAAFAARVLRPGGLCRAYVGLNFLPQVLQRMAERLEYIWVFAIRHNAGMPVFRKLRLRNGWKPIVAFVKPPLDCWWEPHIDMTTGKREKDNHEWQQAVGEATYYLNWFCPDGGLVVDPFCGSGTTLVAAKELQRQYLGFEIDPGVAAAARQRLETT